MRNGHFGKDRFGHKEESFLDDELILGGSIMKACFQWYLTRKTTFVLNKADRGLSSKKIRPIRVIRGQKKLSVEGMRIKELTTVSEGQIAEILSLMGELTSSTVVTPEMLAQTMASATSHFFAIIADDDHIIGCVTLCVYDAPTGQKASVEDVVVSAPYRGQGLDRRLMEHVIGYAKTELHDVNVQLTSRPHRVAANNLYQQLGFQKKDTNVYVMKGEQLRS